MRELGRGAIPLWLCLAIPWWLGGLAGENLGASEAATFFLRLVLMIAAVSIVTRVQRYISES